ncbi:MAG: DUF433 domain-containing protein [Hyphomicrobiaceae bacterium]
MTLVSRQLLEKIGALPVERVAEVEDFVELLHRREQRRLLPPATETTDTPGFAEARGLQGDALDPIRIMRDPNVMMGKPVVVGTRITVEHILRLLGAGDSIADILRNHPQLTEADIRAAQVYAADYLAHESISAAE